MMTALDELIHDLAEEQRALEVVLLQGEIEGWDRLTHAPGWSVRDQISHLAHFDEAAALAIADPDVFAAQTRQAARSRSDGDNEASYLTRGRAMTPVELLAWWRRAGADLVAASRGLDERARLPWYGPAMGAVSFLTARLMETWSHGLDVVDVAGVTRSDTDRLRHVAFLGVRTRPYSYAVRGLEPPPSPVRVNLTLPSGAMWSAGEPDAPDRISGSVADFCRVVTQRRHLADTDLTVEGDAAIEWMTIAQAFAGPPGAGRQPGQFPK